MAAPLWNDDLVFGSEVRCLPCEGLDGTEAAVHQEQRFALAVDLVIGLEPVDVDVLPVTHG